jgi:acyl transferase domain-containing protein
LRAQLDPKDTSFVEAHGTGTAQGDPTEARALGRVFGNDRPKGQPLIIGAVKSNIGHLEGCSGIAGVVKTILSLERGVIPPNANFERLNPDIDAEELNIKFPTERTSWPVLDVRRASVNSFGFGGSNAHIILEHTSSFFATTGAMEYPESVDNRRHDTQQASTKLEEPQLVVISAYDESGVSRLSKLFDDYFADSSDSNTALPDFQDIAYTLTKRRTHLPFRSYAVVNHSSDLASFSALLSRPVRQRRADGIAFVFTGQGAQYSQMGMELMAYPTFKASLSKANLCLRAMGCDWDLFEELEKLESTSNVQRPEYSQSLCTALQLALVDLLEHFQIRPRKVVGHSSGEIGAAYAIGSLSFDSALKVAYFRGRLASSLARNPAYKGSMLAVSLSESQITAYLTKFQEEYPSHKIFISCINSTRSVTLGGTLNAITAISARLEVDGIAAQRLRVDVAYHTPHMRELSQEYEHLMGSLESGNSRPGIVMISSVTGRPVDSQELQQPRYWVRNMESTVRFSDALSHAISIFSSQGLSGDSQEIYDVLEVGPHSALQTPVKDIIASLKNRQEIMYHTALRRKTGALDSLMNTVGRLHCLGYPIDLAVANLANSKYRRVVANLPSYPFDTSKRYWHESRISQEYRLRKAPRLDLLGAPLTPNGPQQLGRTWRKITKLSEASWIRDHVINDTIIYPAAGMLCMAVEAIRQLVDPKTQIVKYVIREANITHPLLVSPEQGNVESYFHLICRDSETNDQCLTAEFTLFTLENDRWEQNCTGIIQAHLDEGIDNSSNSYENTPMADRKISCRLQFGITSMYEDFRSAGYDFGPAFQHMENISFGGDQDAYADIKVFRWEESQSHVIHPVTLDAVFQVMLAARIKSSTEATPTAVPTKIRNLSIVGTGFSFPSEQNLPVYVKVIDMFERTTECYGYGVNEQGNVVLSVECLETTFVDSRVQASGEHVEQPFCYNIVRKPDCDLLDQTVPLDLCPLSPVRLDRGQYFKDLALLLCNFNMQMTRDLNGTLADIAQRDLRRYLEWVQKQVPTLLPDPNAFAVATGKEPYLLDRMVSLLSEKVSTKSELGITFATVGRRFVGLVNGQLRPSDLHSQDLFRTFFKEASLQAIPQLQGFIELLAFKSPALKIIEISGRGGHLAEKILDCAVIRGAHGTSVPAVTKYHLTDASSEKLNSVRDSLQSKIHGRSVLDTSVLDISKDPMAQGLEKHAYDLIIAANVMHETDDIGVSIRNARKLLKP